MSSYIVSRATVRVTEELNIFTPSMFQTSPHIVTFAMSEERSRKRGYNDDGRDRNVKRSRPHPRIEDVTRRLCQDICEIGESSHRKLLGTLEYMAKPLSIEIDQEPSFRKAILSTIYAVTIEQPHKQLVLSGLIQIASVQNPIVGKYLIEYLHSKAQELIDNVISGETKENVGDNSGDWNKLKLILRFFSCLLPIIENESLIKIFKQFINLAIDLQSESPNERNCLAQEIIYNTLLAIPFISVIDPINDEYKQLATDIYKEILKFPVIETKSLDIISPFVSDVEDSPYTAQSLISLAFIALEKIANNNWNIDIFPDITSRIEPAINDNLGRARRLEKHNLPALSIPNSEAFTKYSNLNYTNGNVDSLWKYPRIFFRCYLSGIYETVPPVDTFESLIFRDICTDFIESMDFNRKEVSRQLITLDLFFRPTAFAEPGISIDQLRSTDIDGNTISTWKVEDVAVESVFSQIMSLPHLTHPPAYFFSILVECCLKSATTIAPVFGRAIRFFYTHLISMDFELIHRFLDWVSVQLSNFDFTWKWQEWVEEINKLNENENYYHPKIIFLKEFICKNVRLSSRDRIKMNLIEDFHKYLNTSLLNREEMKKYDLQVMGEDLEKSENDDKDESMSDDGNKNKNDNDEIDDDYTKEDPILKLLEPNSQYIQETQNILSSFREDFSDEDIEKLILEIIEKVELKSPNLNSEKFIINSTFQIICFLGCRSLSHIDTYFNKFSKRLQNIIFKNDEDEEKNLERQQIAISSVLRFWNPQPYVGTVVIKLASNYSIFTPMAIVKFCLNDELNLVIRTNYGYELFFNNLDYILKDDKESLQNDFVSISKQIIVRIKQAYEEKEQEGSIKEDGKWKYWWYKGLWKSVIRKYSNIFIPNMELIKQSGIDTGISEIEEYISKYVDELQEL